MADKMASEYANQLTQNKIRIYSQYFIMDKFKEPKTTMVTDPHTRLMAPVTEEYEYYPGKQLVVNYNGIGISQEEFSHQWMELGKAMWSEMQKNGITR